MAFSASGPTNHGIRTDPGGGLLTFADTRRLVAGGSGTFSSLGRPALAAAAQPACSSLPSMSSSRRLPTSPAAWASPPSRLIPVQFPTSR